MTYTSEYPIISVTVDIVVFSADKQRVLLIQRGEEPFKGKYALPGGFLNPDETLAKAAARELMEETSVDVWADFLTPMPAVYKPGRDPRGPVVSNPFWIRVFEAEEKMAVAGDDAATVQWVEWEELLVPSSLAFDHWNILQDAVEEMRRSRLIGA